jgi:hypothetical protein
MGDAGAPLVADALVRLAPARFTKALVSRVLGFRATV